MKNTRLSRFLIILFLFASIFPAGASVLKDSFHKEIANPGRISKVSLNNVNGNCHFFVTREKQKIVIDAAVTIKGSSDDACESYYRKVKIQVIRKGKALKIVVNRPRSSSFFGFGNSIHMSVDFEIGIPMPTDVSLELINGNINIENMANCSVDLVNGDIKMNGIKSASIEAVNSCMKIQDLKKWIVIDAVNGSLTLSTASSELEKVKSEFVNGSMRVQIPQACLGGLSMESATGIVHLKEKNGDKGWKTKMRGKNIHIKDKGKAKISLENVNGKITLLCY